MKNNDQIVEGLSGKTQSRQMATVEWDNLLRERQIARILPMVWFSCFLLLSAIGAILTVKRGGHLGVFALSSTVFLILTSPLIFIGGRRSERALISVISREAPELSKKLKGEGVR